MDYCISIWYEKYPKRKKPRKIKIGQGQPKLATKAA
jgi:hypothetical protein